MNIKCISLFGFLLLSLTGYCQKDIFEVARSGSVNEVKALMAIQADTINAVGESGYLPLTLACYNGNREVALYLLKHVKDINGSSKMGTPLMAAVFKVDVAVVKALLERNADPNLADDNGTTPLHYAVLSRNERLVELLVDAKANVDDKDKRGNSALDYGHMTQSQSLMEILNKNKI